MRRRHSESQVSIRYALSWHECEGLLTRLVDVVRIAETGMTY